MKLKKQAPPLAAVSDIHPKSNERKNLFFRKYINSIHIQFLIYNDIIHYHIIKITEVALSEAGFYNS